MPHWTAKGPKPPHRFCWHCSRQLHGRQFAIVIGDDGNKHAVHKSCAERYYEPGAIVTLDPPATTEKGAKP